MQTSASPRSWRRSVIITLVGVVMLATSACTGRGGGQLPPNSPLFSGAASFGFSFSCERSSNSTSTNPPAGRLAIQLSYTDHGSNPLGAGFSIHGTVDTLDAVLESAVCIGQNPPPGGNELIFLGRYRTTTTPAPSGFPAQCTKATSRCRFEVIVRDNDQNRAPSVGDYFSIALSTATTVSSELDPATVFYARAGLLSGGNLKVD
jgi:hypothetical protein